jgi:hypothetical protein
MSLITDELVWVVRTATPCRRNISARWAENMLSSYRLCRVATRAVLRVFVSSVCPGQLGRPARFQGIVTKYLAAFRCFVKAECCVFGECIKVEVHGEDCEELVQRFARCGSEHA